jgi:DNA-binding transcriptional LysR family regulator
VARRIGLSRRVTVGSPAYFARHGTPQVPEDLTGHNCILYTYNATGSTWQYRGRRGDVEVRVSGTFRSTSGNALRRAALAGIGILNAPVWMVMRELTEGELVAVLPDHEPVPANMNAVWPSVRHPGAKVRLFVEYLQETCARVPLLN